MALFKIEEIFDGRLPEYHVIQENSKNQESKTVKIFDSYEEAEQWINERLVS